MSGLGLVLGTSFEPRNIGLMFGFIILPITFLDGTYYPSTGGVARTQSTTCG
jgi:ABC-2 type transport system permease protein